MMDKEEINQMTELFKALSDDGKQIYYKLADNHVRQVLKIGMEHVNERQVWNF